MFHTIPTYIWPFIFAVIAALFGFMFAHRHVRGEPSTLVSRILYAVAAGCVIIGFATWGLSNMA